MRGRGATEVLAPKTGHVYRLLVVRTAPVPADRPASDLTARARIRDAAIACFAEEGFGASFRTIASRADVSPGLITHHFGSKEALRAECDAEVLRQYTAFEVQAIDMPTDEMFRLVYEPGFSANLLVYMLRAINAGGQPSRDFLERLVGDVRRIMARSVETGLVRPSRDEEARLRYLTYMTMGALLVEFVTTPGRTPCERSGWRRSSGWACARLTSSRIRWWPTVRPNGPT